MNCLVCDRIDKIKQDINPYFVYELETGYVVIGDYQHFKGYTLFLCKQHVTELHDLDNDFKQKYLSEMSLVAEAVFNAFKPEKLNYELLGTGNATHMHWHLFPRNTGDTPVVGPVWKLPKEEMYDKKNKLNSKELEAMKDTLRSELIRILNK